MTRNARSVELVVALVIIGLLVMVMMGGAKVEQKLLLARNATRSRDVEKIMMAVQQYLLDNEKYPEGVGGEVRQIGSCVNGGEAGCEGWYKCLNLEKDLQKYMEIIPVDPEFGTKEKTGYALHLDEYGILTVKACGAEGGGIIEVSR